MKKSLKIGFVGIGSIAKRHLKNLVHCLKERGYEYVIDVIRSGHGTPLTEDLQQFICSSYVYGQEIPEDYDIMFFTNPTAMHFDAIKKYGKCGKNLFIEKPVFHTYNLDVSELGLREDGVQYVACPLRYTNVIQYLKDNIDCSEVFSVRAICSSYLPEWRPETDYRKTYSAHKDMGGGVSIDLIHEWDYLTYLFGMPDKVINICGNYSNLEIDSDDCSIYIGKSDAMLYELHLDYFGRETIRKVEIFTEDETIVGDLNKSEIRYLRSGKQISFKEKRDDYQVREMKRFLDVIEGKAVNENTIENALKVLKIAKGE